MNSLNIMLMVNSSLLILFILNQNETNKELTNNTNSGSSSNPLEKFTWGCLVLQFVFFLIKTKTTDF